LLLARGRELDIITQAEAVDTYPQISADLVRLGQAAYIVELLDRFSVEEGEGSSSIYHLLTRSLERLSLEGSNPSKVVLHFELRLLDAMGYRPELFRCLECGNEVRPEDQFFSYLQGGLLCAKGGREERNVRPISLEALKVLRHYQRSHFEHASQARISPSTFVEVEQVMDGYLTYLLERKLNAPAFIKKVRFLDRQKAEGDEVRQTQG
jgi:DNA repair protein RecO (recombination protein O)